VRFEDILCAMPIATLRPAATVVVLRAGDLGSFDVLMVRRNDKVAFMAGAYVFPGGRVDENDRAVEPAAIGAWTARFGDLSAAEEQVYRAAAARELQEEANVQIDPADLVPLAHWVTPEIEIRRFDTRFFIVPMPPDQEARHDAGETTALEWLSPADALIAAEQGTIMLPPPTYTTLKRLARHASIDEALDAARRSRIVRVQPMLIKTDEHTLLTLPGDPTYPAIEGWDVPEDTRFRLQDGRWRPIPV
jgi:8-oxo-dGTP pyrophosphatase MutT (NUDIX family)